MGHNVPQEAPEAFAKAMIDADSLGYISLEGLVAATEQPSENLCRACFDGVYPIELPEPELLGKHLLEVEPVVPAFVPGHDALTRP